MTRVELDFKKCLCFHFKCVQMKHAVTVCHMTVKIDRIERENK